MAQSVQGVIAREKGAPVEIATIVVPDPGPGEALVRVQACGVCHTDLHYRQGGIGDDFPYFLGHEAAGVVEAVGEDVTDVAPGDFVILNWRAVCGECRACRRGRAPIPAWWPKVKSSLSSHRRAKRLLPKLPQRGLHAIPAPAPRARAMPRSHA